MPTLSLPFFIHSFVGWFNNFDSSFLASLRDWLLLRFSRPFDSSRSERIVKRCITTDLSDNSLCCARRRRWWNWLTFSSWILHSFSFELFRIVSPVSECLVLLFFFHSSSSDNLFLINYCVLQQQSRKFRYFFLFCFYQFSIARLSAGVDYTMRAFTSISLFISSSCVVTLYDFLCFFVQLTHSAQLDRLRSESRRGSSTIISITLTSVREK